MCPRVKRMFSLGAKKRLPRRSVRQPFCDTVYAVVNRQNEPWPRQAGGLMGTAGLWHL